MADDTTTCPKCGHENPASSEDCANCGITFDIYKKERVKKEPAKTAQKADNTGQTDKLATCPSCGQPTDLSSGDCLGCGIVFSKYFKIQEKALEDNPEKLQALMNLKETHEKAVALLLERREQEKTERLLREKIAREKADALRKQKAEQAKFEEMKKQQVGKEKQDALKKQEEEFNRQQAAKLQQIEKEKQATLDKQKGALEKTAALDLQQAQQEKQGALKKQKEQFEQQQAKRREQSEKEKQTALDKQKKDYEKAVAEQNQQTEAVLDKQKKDYEKAVAEQSQQAEKERRDALRKQKEDLEKNQSTDRIQELLKNFPPPSSIRDLIKKYEGQTVGINVEGPWTLTPVLLARVCQDHFSVLKTETGQLHSFPFTAVTSLAEGTTGITAGKGDTQKTVFLAVRIYQPGS